MRLRLHSGGKAAGAVLDWMAELFDKQGSRRSPLQFLSTRRAEPLGPELVAEWLCGAFANGAATGLAALAAPVFALLALFSVVLAARADTGEPGWREPDSSARLVFIRPHQENFCLLSTPATFDAVNVTGGKAWSDGDVRPVRLVWADATNAFFLVNCRGVPEQQEVALYLLTNAVPPATDANFSDPLPVRFYAQRTAGQDLPATWEQLQILDTRVDRDPFHQSLAEFDTEAGAPTGWYRGDWQRKNHLFQLSSWVLFPVAGRYVFGLKTDQPVWLTVDGKLMMEHLDSRQADWTTARPREIAAGLHHVVARGVTRQNLHIAAGWLQEGHANAPGVVAVTGGEMLRARFERRDHRLHAFAVATIAQPYTFENATNVFVQVRLESDSISRDGFPVTCAWRLEGRDLGAGRVCKALLCLPAPAGVSTADSREHTQAGAGSGTRCIELTVADNHGNTARDTVPVALDGPPRAQYCVSGRLVGVPAVGYEEDPVRPEIHVRATSPDGIDFTAEAAIERANGSITNIAGPVDIVRSWGRLVLPADTADAFNRIDWRVLHGGVVLDHGATVFERTPFRTRPDALDGDMLCVRTNALMLVARRASVGAPTLFEGLRPGQSLLLLDGFLAPDGGDDTNLVVRLDSALGGFPGTGGASSASPAFDDNRRRGTRPSIAIATEGVETGGASSASPSSYRRINLRAMETAGSANGVTRLMLLVQAGSLLPADVVVVAPPFDALAQGETLAQFERRLAALAGLFSGPGHATVVLVTPPPFAILPGCEELAAAGVRPPDARQLAEVVCRVADAYGLPVADLYTSFMTAGDCAPLIRNGALTAAGMEQAVEVLRRVLFER